MGASVCTHPLDTLKVRMQLAGMNEKGKAPSTFGTVIRVIKDEGPFAFYKGLSASLLRQATYTTARIGLYLKIKEYMERESANVGVLKKIGGSMIAGAGGAIVGSPADVILVRMQADGKLPLDQRRNYKNVFHGLSVIIKEEGIARLWRGCMPNVGRAMLMTAGQLASYDVAKEVLLNSGMKDGRACHFSASLMAGFVATTITSPVDVVKTRVMNQKDHQYKNAIDCAGKILRSEGPFAFYKGFIPYFLRLGPHTIITFLIFEELAKVFRGYNTK
eukprot:TRINITY_DN15159_c0_g1_i1.p1 TRINITY_DN15159_c0_g1~~TRINITY_DN15159_c0_g1_i1.p1  ORF type:complete len:305 (+),score=66.56 TRINITY_DN15159_c0_g1_i1:92-916(+)